MYRFLVCGLAAMLSLAAAPLLAQNQGLLDRRFDLNIPPQSVTTAVIELSRQAGVQVLISGNRIDQNNTKGVSGTMTLRHALSALLACNQCRISQTDESTITIDASNAQ